MMPIVNKGVRTGEAETCQPQKEEAENGRRDEAHEQVTGESRILPESETGGVCRQ